MRTVVLLVILGGCDLVFELNEPGEARGLRRRTITLTLENQGPLENVPIHVSLNGDADLRQHLRKDGLDLRFEADGVPLLHEIAALDQSSGVLDAWVRIPQLVRPAATFDMLYGDGIELAPAPSGDVWGDTAAAVWHLGEAATAFDSSHGGIALRPTAGAVPGIAGGIAGNGRRFSGGEQLCADAGADFDPADQTFSVSLWVAVEEANGEYDVPIGRGGGNVNVPGWNFELGIGEWVFNVSDANRITHLAPSLTEEPMPDWVQLVAVLDRGSPSTLRTYVNGAARPFDTVSNLGPVSAFESTCIGRSDLPFTGVIDEARIYRRALSIDEIEIEYANLGRREQFMDIADPPE
jgi:hypothetical protein